MIKLHIIYIRERKCKENGTNEWEKEQERSKKIPQVIILFKSLVLWTVEVEEHPFVLDIHKICYLTKPFVTVRLSLNTLRTEYWEEWTEGLLCAYVYVDPHSH